VRPVPAGSRPAPAPAPAPTQPSAPAAEAKKPAAPGRSPAEDLVEQGSALNAKGDYAGAADAFRKAQAADPKHLGASYSLGVALQNAKKWGEAGDAYEGALRLDRSLALAHAHLAECRLQQGDKISAQRSFEDATRAGPELPGPWIGLALLQSKEGRNDVAVRTLQSGARMAGEHAELHYHLGLLLEVTGDPVKARAAYEKAVELDPKDAYALNNLGLLLEKTDVDRAIGLWERAVLAAPDLVESRKNLGAALHKRKGKSWLALEHLERAVALGTKDVARVKAWIEEIRETCRTYRTDDRALAVFDRFEGGQVCLADGAFPVRDAAVADRARAHVKRGDRVRLVFESPQSPKLIAVELLPAPK
jgi:tetratricopeptide (TPR) repeat protein